VVASIALSAPRGGKRFLCIQKTLKALEKAEHMGQLTGRTAVVTGAANGIGRGIATRLAREGAAIGILDQDAAGCHSVCREIRDSGGHAMTLVADVSDAGAVERAIRGLAEKLGPPTLAVHSAAIMPTGTILETDEPEWERVYAVNVKGAYLLCRGVIPYMLRAGRGSIIFMASITGVNGLPGLAAYSSTKGALIALSRALAIDHARNGIRVNAVAPGTIDSPMLHGFVAAQGNPQETRRVFDEVQPRGRIGTIEEVANVVAFLASDESSLISGATLAADGGMSIKSEQPRM
jgi:NAD(P)-dependent dehydrogenase (short-subunit alcohol dehydrogenase family)